MLLAKAQKAKVLIYVQQTTVTKWVFLKQKESHLPLMFFVCEYSFGLLVYRTLLMPLLFLYVFVETMIKGWCLNIKESKNLKSYASWNRRVQISGKLLPYSICTNAWIYLLTWHMCANMETLVKFLCAKNHTKHLLLAIELHNKLITSFTLGHWCIVHWKKIPPQSIC